MSQPDSTALARGREHDPPTAETGHPSDRLYARCHATLRPALAGRLGSLHDAEDVLHEAFARFLKSYAGKHIENPLALLARIAMNIVRDTARSNTFRRTLLAREVEPVCTIAPRPDPEAEASGRQDVRHLCDAIDALPPRCREVFLLHRVEGLSHAEVADILGISRSGVEKHLIRAQSQLRPDLDQIGWGGVDRMAARKA